MSTRRVNVEIASELNRNHSLPSIATENTERIPLVQIEHEIPSPPPLPASISDINKKQMTSNRSFDMRRRATIAAAAKASIRKTSSIGIINQTDSTIVSCHDDSDIDSIHQSNSSRTTNKFLQELRLKRRELKAKAKNFTIDQRIAFNRREQQRTRPRAQDIFDVHFECADGDDDIEENLLKTNVHLFTEESQEKIRDDIFQELDRQRKKQFHKYHRHLLFGRTLLVLTTLFLIFMSLVLVFVVIDLYDRAQSLNSKLPDNEFVSIDLDKSIKGY